MVNKDLMELWTEVLKKALTFIFCNNCKEIVFGKNCIKCRKDPQKWNHQNDCSPSELPEIFENFPTQAAACIRLVIRLVFIIEKFHICMCCNLRNYKYNKN